METGRRRLGVSEDFVSATRGVDDNRIAIERSSQFPPRKIWRQWYICKIATEE